MRLARKFVDQLDKRDIRMTVRAGLHADAHVSLGTIVNY
jgi:hypothetical protein